MLITHRWHDYKQLMRLDKPVGTYLLLWPMLWALWLAAEGMPRLDLLCIFVVGTYLMRAAGCVINDYADRHLDGHVERTKQRPLATGKITSTQALMLFFGLCSTAFVLVLFTNTATIKLSVIAVILAATYPFMKRYTYLPQAFLGIAFSWGIPMAFTAVNNEIANVAWLLLIANLLWVVAYDTQYAMVDRDDDIKLGLKSTAILFAELDRTMIAILQVLFLATLLLVTSSIELSVYYYLGLIGATGLFIHQHYLTWNRSREGCFKAFLSNHWVGLSVFLGVVAHYSLP